jgi:hypothetical protein
LNALRSELDDLKRSCASLESKAASLQNELVLWQLAAGVGWVVAIVVCLVKM